MRVPAKQARIGLRKDFAFEGIRAGKAYLSKQVLAIVVDEPTEVVVVTVYTFYF